jgi:hypothetical protein
MKVAMELTLDGLVRALRSRAHGLAEDVEAGYADAVPDAVDAFEVLAQDRQALRATGLRMRMSKDDERGG